LVAQVAQQIKIVALYNSF